MFRPELGKNLLSGRVGTAWANVGIFWFLDVIIEIIDWPGFSWVFALKDSAGFLGRSLNELYSDIFFILNYLNLFGRVFYSFVNFNILLNVLGYFDKNFLIGAVYA